MATELKQAIRRAFERAAHTYDHSAFLQREVARRLDEHLEEMKISPRVILDAGCGTGSGFPLLSRRFPEAEVVALDLAHSMLCQARQAQISSGWRGWWGRVAAQRRGRLLPLCADIEHLPLARHSLDMVWSSLSLQWVDLPRAFHEFQRVLKPGGLLLFASLGPDTLHELRAAGQGVDGHARVNDFVDMHDVGDALVAAGFSHPVMEMERLTLTYQELRALLFDLKGIGARTIMAGRRDGLMGKGAWAQLQANYERFRQDGRLPATYEVVYGHAWAGQPNKLADGRQIIEFRKRLE